MQLDPLTARVYRHGIALVVAFDAVQLVVRTLMRARLAASLLPVPPAFRALALSPVALVALGVVGVVASACFARTRRPVLFGVVALIAIRLLLEAFGALDGIFDETTYHAGAALLGWIAGALYARAVAGRRASGDAPRDDEQVVAGLGAVAAFAATYVCAGTSKLLDSGLSWADGDTIRLMVLAHRPVGVSTWNDALRTLVANDARFAMALSLGTLLVQLGAVFFPWSRWTRAVWGSLFLAFHVGIHLVSGSIFFLQAVYLALLFALPWWRFFPRAAAREPDVAAPAEPLAPGSARRVWAAVALVLLVGAGLLVLPIEPRAHPIERVRRGTPGGTSGERTRATARDHFGPIAVGMDLAEGWSIEAIAIERDLPIISVARSGDVVTFDLSDQPDAPSGPFDTHGLHISYREAGLPFESFSAAGARLGQLLADADSTGELRAAFRTWVDDAR